MMTHHGLVNRRGFMRRTGISAAVLGFGMRGAAEDSFSAEAAIKSGTRISYFRNGEIHVNEVGQPDRAPLTRGHMDFKPSWSKTGDMLVCFRRVKDDPVTVMWKSAIFIIQADGTGFHTLSDGTRTDFNPTWTRDGKNTPIWNRKNDETGGFFVVRGRVGGAPGQEVALSDAKHHTWAHSCLMDGRILVNSLHPAQGWGVYLMGNKADGAPEFERVEWELGLKGQMHRASVSPSEKRICFEYLPGSNFREPGHTLYIADFDGAKRTISNCVAIANKEGKPQWYAYPRWIEGESAVIYHSSESGRNQLYVYRLEDGTTRRVSVDGQGDYRYPHGEAAPC